MAKAASTYTNEEKSNAKKGGFKRKKPSTKKSGTHAQLEKRLDSYNEWVKELKAAAKVGKDREALKASLSKAK